MELYLSPNQIDPRDIRRKNFSGRPDNFGNQRRTFQLRIAEDDALLMQRDGWPIESWPMKNAQGIPTGETGYAMTIRCDFNPYPPEIRSYSGGKFEILTEKTVGILDSSDIEAIGMRIRTSKWSRGPKEGITVYLQKMSVKLKEDEMDTFFSQYLDEPAPVYVDDDDQVPFDMG